MPQRQLGGSFARAHGSALNFDSAKKIVFFFCSGGHLELSNDKTSRRLKERLQMAEEEAEMYQDIEETRGDIERVKQLLVAVECIMQAKTQEDLATLHQNELTEVEELRKTCRQAYRNVFGQAYGKEGLLDDVSAVLKVVEHLEMEVTQGVAARTEMENSMNTWEATAAGSYGHLVTTTNNIAKFLDLDEPYRLPIERNEDVDMGKIFEAIHKALEEKELVMPEMKQELENSKMQIKEMHEEWDAAQEAWATDRNMIESLRDQQEAANEEMADKDEAMKELSKVVDRFNALTTELS